MLYMIYFAKMTQRSNNYTLIADTRESAVIPFLSEYNVSVVERQITTGDYAILLDKKIIACFERKTLEDFADSFKDGRYSNVEKMRDMRACCGCDLYFIVEGNPFPADNTKYHGIPYSSILSAITNLMVRDKIQIIYTKDQSHTAKRLSEIVHSYEALHEPKTDLQILHEKITSLQKLSETLYQNSIVEVDCDEVDCAEVNGGDEDLLTKKIITSDYTVANNMWSVLPGISNVTAKIISTKISLHELVNGKVNLDDIKTAQGKKLLPKAKQSLIEVARGDTTHISKMLAAIPSISLATIKLLVSANENNIISIINAQIHDLSEIKIQQSSRVVRFGEAKAEKIYNMVRFIAPS